MVGSKYRDQLVKFAERFDGNYADNISGSYGSHLQDSLRGLRLDGSCDRVKVQVKNCVQVSDGVGRMKEDGTERKSASTCRYSEIVGGSFLTFGSQLPHISLVFFYCLLRHLSQTLTRN